MMYIYNKNVQTVLANAKNIVMYLGSYCQKKKKKKRYHDANINLTSKTDYKDICACWRKLDETQIFYHYKRATPPPLNPNLWVYIWFMTVK